MSDKKFPELVDVLPQGRHVIKVYPKKVYDKEKGEFIEGSHHQGVSKVGKWYMYQTKIDDKYINLFASDKDKHFYDTGQVEANIIPKQVDGKDVFDRDGSPLLKAFINEIKDKKSGEPAYEPPESSSAPF